MRTFAIALGCLAWVLSCFDAVSYYRAGIEQQALEARLKTATTHAASAEASAGQDSAALSVRLTRDQAAIDTDQLAIARDGKLNLGDARDKQVLAADQAALQADRMMQYTVESFARTDPNPQVVAAENKVDLNKKRLADTVATRARDLSLSHVLLALWTLVVGTALIAFRRGSGEGIVEELQDEDHAEAGSEVVIPEDADV